LINQAYIQLDVKFTLGAVSGIIDPDDGDDEKIPADNTEGFSPAGFCPIQSTCVRNAVVSINGASCTYRPAEYMKDYLKLQLNQEYCKKSGWAPWEEYTKPRLGRDRIYNESEAIRAEQFRYNATKDGRAKWTGEAGGDTFTMSFQEPLCIGPFGGCSGQDEYPLWSCEGQKSPTILHASQTQITLNMLDNWYQNLFGMRMGRLADAVSAVKIEKAYLCATFVQPPPKFVASALSAQTTLAVPKFLRYRMDPDDSAVWLNKTQKTFSLRSTSFPYMPSAFMFSCCPDYQLKSKVIPVYNSAVNVNHIRISKEDKRMQIYELDLMINTANDVCPRAGGASFVGNESSMCSARFNAKTLYNLYLKNTSKDKALYSFKDWSQSGCVVILTRDDFNGILPSPHVRGNLSIQGTVFCRNMTGIPAHVGSGAPGNHANFCGDTSPIEKFQCSITAIYGILI